MSASSPVGNNLETMTQDQLDALVRLHDRFLNGRIGGRRAILKHTDISDLSLFNQDLRQAEFVGCAMTRMNLSGTDFQEASLYACDLSDSNLYRTKFIRSDLRGARIENANLEGANLESADLRMGGVASDDNYDPAQAVNFRGANLSGAKLVGSTANNADFSDAILAGANMTGADFSGAKLEGADLSNADVKGANFKGADMNATILTGVEVSNISGQLDLSDAITDENIGISVSDMDIPLAKMIETHREWVDSAGKSGEQLDLSGIDMRFLKSMKLEKLTAIKALETKFFGMNLYKVELQSAQLDRADFRNCDMEEADLRGASFKGAQFSHAVMKGVNCNALMFGGGGATKRFSPTNFEGAKLRYVDLSGAQLKNVSFKDADLAYANFKGADVRDADFTGANMDYTILDDIESEGAIFDKDDARPVFQMKTED